MSIESVIHHSLCRPLLLPRQHQGLSNESFFTQMARELEFTQHQIFQWIFSFYFMMD